MGETSPAKLWAILAPLAALAGLAWLHLQRRKVKDGKNNSVRQAVELSEGGISREPNECKTERNSGVHETIEERSDDDKNLIIRETRAGTMDSGFDSQPPTMEKIEINYSLEEEVVEKLVEDELSLNNPAEKIDKIEEVDNAKVLEIEYHNPIASNEVETHSLQDDDIVIVPSESDETSSFNLIEQIENKEELPVALDVSTVLEIEESKESDLSHINEVSEDIAEGNSITGNTIDKTEEDKQVLNMKEVSEELCERHTLTESSIDGKEDTEILKNDTSDQILLPEVQIENAVLEESQTPEVDNGVTSNGNRETTSPGLLEQGALTSELVAVEATDKNVGSGKSGLVVASARTRNISECTQEMCDWKSSPCPTKEELAKSAETPMKEPIRPEERVTKSRKTKRKSVLKDTNVEQNGFQRRIAGMNNIDDRDSVTTSPDSAKVENDQKVEKNQKKSSRKKRARNGGGSRKNGKGKSSRSRDNSDNKSKNSSEINDLATSSDSGTHTDDHNETFVEISGFPSELIGALIGKNGSSIKKMQSDAKCKVIVKNCPVESGQQCISIEGLGKNVRRAVAMLKKKFPTLNLTDGLPANQTYSEINQVISGYDHSEYFTGSANNNMSGLQVELVEGIPVEVRVTAMSQPGVLWVQPFTHPTHDHLPRLEARMSDFYTRDTQESILTYYLEMGDFAVCFHHAPDEITGQELGKWYRVQIIQYPDDMHACVLFLDFGGYATVPIEMIRKLMPEYHPHFSGCPFQAICTSLDGVDVKTEVKDQNSYNTEASVLVHDIIQKSQPNSIEASVVSFDKDLNMPCVVLRYKNEMNEVISVNEVLADRLQKFN